jgi:crossover junction endodeoxyribonuclease RusA
MHIWVSGDPAPQGSVKAFAIKKGKGKDAHYTGKVGIASASPAHGSWRNEVVRAAAEELKRAGMTLADLPLFGADWPCSVEIRFYLPRPKSHYGTGRNAGQIKPQYATVWPLVKDFDKLTRTILDALQLAGVVADDKQFVGTPGIWRIYADYCQPGADIWVEPAPAGIPALSLMPGLRRKDRLEPGPGRPPLVDFKTGAVLVSGESQDATARRALSDWLHDEHPADCDGTEEMPHEGFGGQPITSTCQHPSHRQPPGPSLADDLLASLKRRRAE